MNNPPGELLLDVTEDAPMPPELAGDALPGKIARLRRHRLRGACVVFHPYERSFGESLRALRNLPHNRANLAQPADITADQQRGWEDAYFARGDDLCWVLLTPGGDFAGSVSLYDIGAESAETGRLVIREEIARSSPIIAECELMIQRLAFRWLGLPRVLARIQPGNAKMVVMHERLGFQAIGTSAIRGVPYLQFEVSPARYRPGPHARVIRHWRSRATGSTPGSTPAK